MTNWDTLRLIEIIAWPLTAILAIFLFKRPLSDALGSKRIKVTIFGVEIETTGKEVIDVVWKNLNYFNPAKAQWALLERLAKAREGIPKAEALKTLDYKTGLRPLRNAGLMRGDGSSLDRSMTLLITPLGEFVVLNAKTQQKGRTEATPIHPDIEDDASAGVPRA